MAELKRCRHGVPGCCDDCFRRILEDVGIWHYRRRHPGATLTLVVGYALGAFTAWWLL